MKGKPKWKPPQVSNVARAFGAHAGTNYQCAERFIKSCVPGQWHPKIILPELWHDFQGRSDGFIQYGIWLDNFVHRIDNPNDWKHMRQVWIRLGNVLSRRFLRVENSVVSVEGGTVTDKPPHLWKWNFQYEAKPFNGSITIWIIPQSKKKALLIASLTEYRARSRPRTIMRNSKFKTGAWVTLAIVPEWVTEMPIETRRVFQVCHERSYEIINITPEGLLVLDVSRDVDTLIGGKHNDLRVERRYVRAARTRRLPIT